MNNFISVVMATYNGAFYIEQQLLSILSELGVNDELIVYDDASSDSTVELIESFKDDRIFIVRGIENVGVNRAFELVLVHSTGRYIFFADQDDIWKPGRVRLMLDSIEKNGAFLVSGRFDFIDKNSNAIDVDFDFLKSEESDSNVVNILRIFSGRANYYGCAMAIDREYLSYILPFPADLESHDLWIALCANALKKNAHLDDVVLSRRLHGSNLSIVNRSLGSKLKSRLIFAKHFLIIYFRVFKSRYLK